MVLNLWVLAPSNEKELLADMEKVQTWILLLLVVITVLMIVGVMVLNRLSKNLTDAINKLADDIRPMVKSIHEQVENLKPSIDLINGKKAEIERVLSELPETVKNLREISENILPTARLIGEKAPEIKNTLETLSSATGRLRDQAEALNEKMRPTVGTISGIAQALMEGLKVFKSFKR